MTRVQARQKKETLDALRYGLGLAAMRAIEGDPTVNVEELKAGIAEYRAEWSVFLKELDAEGIVL